MKIHSLDNVKKEEQRRNDRFLDKQKSDDAWKKGKNAGRKKPGKQNQRPRLQQPRRKSPDRILSKILAPGECDQYRDTKNKIALLKSTNYISEQRF